MPTSTFVLDVDPTGTLAPGNVDNQNLQMTWIEQADPTAANGTNKEFYIGGGPGLDAGFVNITLLRADLSGTPTTGIAIPAGAKIQSAKISLCFGPDEPWGFQRVIAGGSTMRIVLKLIDNTGGVLWLFSSVTYNKRKTGTDWTAPGGDYLATPTASHAIPPDLSATGGNWDFDGAEITGVFRHVFTRLDGILDCGIMVEGGSGTDKFSAAGPDCAENKPLSEQELAADAIYPTVTIVWSENEIQPAKGSVFGYTIDCSVHDAVITIQGSQDGTFTDAATIDSFTLTAGQRVAWPLFGVRDPSIARAGFPFVRVEYADAVEGQAATVVARGSASPLAGLVD